MTKLTRRSILQGALAGAIGMTASPLLDFAQNAAGKGKKVLFFTRSQGFPHSVVTRDKPEELALAERIFKELAEKAGFDLTVSKDGTLFDPDKIGQWDAFAFYTTGDLTQQPTAQYPKSDHTPPMSPEGKAAFLKAIQDGKGFIGFHSATDTFHSQRKNEMLRAIDAPDYIDPYIAMIGGEFSAHGQQQKATIRPGSKTFPGLKDQADFELSEEWYSLYNLDPNMHVILIQDTESMDQNGKRQQQYQRDPYPETWARMHGKGRVFYTSMAHREDTWTNPLFQKIAVAGLAWASGNIDAEIPPNMAMACPKLAATLKKPT